MGPDAMILVFWKVDTKEYEKGRGQREANVQKVHAEGNMLTDIVNVNILVMIFC